MPDADNSFGGSLGLDFRKMMTSRATQDMLALPAFLRSAFFHYFILFFLPK